MISIIRAGTSPAFHGVDLVARLDDVLAGVLVESVGIIPTVGAIGVVYVAAALAMSLNPALKAMDRERVPSTEP
jgi:hypothetical protein